MTCGETEQALWVPQGIISAAASAGFAISDTEWMLEMTVNTLASIEDEVRTFVSDARGGEYS